MIDAFSQSKHTHVVLRSRNITKYKKFVPAPCHYSTPREARKAHNCLLLLKKTNKVRNSTGYKIVL